MTTAYTADPMNPPPMGYEPVDRYSGAYEAAAPASTSAVSWAAVFAGAVAAAALSLILLILGTGLGMTAVSPWTHEGIGAKALGISTIVWLTVMQLLSSGMGGYLAGRLRTRWPDAARDEVFFRDTAHGFLAWAVATLLTAAVLTSTISALVGAGVQAGASVVGGAANSAALAAGGAMAGRDATAPDRQSSAIDYFVDTLFREPAASDTASATPPATPSAPAPASDATAPSPGAESSPPPTDPAPPASPSMARTSPEPGRSAAQDSAEIARIYMNADLSQPLPAEDERRVAQIVAQRTGLTQAQAEQRVRQNHEQLQSRLQETEDKARAAADEARKVSATSALWLFVSLLVGAFVASLAATFGGRQRDA